MNRLTDIRLHAQQLVAPQFDDPVELIRWMGMVQAQEYGSAKWAVALRLRTLAAAPVEEALREGRILRMHIMRPTWHFIAAEDVRWMLHLSARRIRAANASFAKGNGCGLDEGDYLRCSRLLERILGGGNHLTRQQIAGELERAGMAVDAPRLNRLMMHAETDGVVCSGADRAGKPTYALLAERVPQAVDLPEEEALALLALRYFRSHSPATFDDFVWWSGLPVGQARRGVGALDGELLRESFGGREYLLHESWATCRKAPAHAHLLPAFDEYLIAYKDRSDVLAPEHRARAFNDFGVFRPVLLHGGRIVGRWGRKGTAWSRSPVKNNPPRDSCGRRRDVGTCSARDRRFRKGVTVRATAARALPARCRNRPSARRSSRAWPSARECRSA